MIDAEMPLEPIDAELPRRSGAALPLQGRRGRDRHYLVGHAAVLRQLHAGAAVLRGAPVHAVPAGLGPGFAGLAARRQSDAEIAVCRAGDLAPPGGSVLGAATNSTVDDPRVEMSTHRGLMVITRHFTVAVFVVDVTAVLLHYHRKLGTWPPPVGHIEPHARPDDAASFAARSRRRRACGARLVGERGVDLASPPYRALLFAPRRDPARGHCPRSSSTSTWSTFAVPIPGGRGVGARRMRAHGTGLVRPRRLAGVGANE